MKGNRKRREKKNLFQDSDEDNKPKVQNSEGQEDLEKKETKDQFDMYDPAKLEENEIYINKKQSNNDGFKMQEHNQEEQRESDKKIKRQRKTQKKNLFLDSDDDGEKEVNKKEKQSKLSELDETDNNLIISKGQQRKYKSSSESLSESEEEENGNDIEKIVTQKAEKEKQVKQINFQKIVNDVGKGIEERRKILTQPLKNNFKANFYFRRQTVGFSDVFQLLGEDERPLIFCENQRGSIGANFYFSMTKEMDKKSEAYLGKLRGNASGSTYQLYDSGIQPNKNLDRRQWRTSLAYVDYENNFMGMNGPRKFRVSLPNFEKTEDIDSFKLAENENLTIFQPPIITNYRNKQPRWNERLKSYALNFGGRVKQASIKNFILIDNTVEPEEEPNAQNLLVFGKVDDNTFSLEFRPPLSPLQAFGIATSEFDFKLNCE